MGNPLQPHGHVQVDNAAIQDLVTVTEATTCEICTEPLSPGNVFNNSNRCVHSFCLDCTAKYVKFKILDDMGNIPCPAWKCKHLLDPMFFGTIISKHLFDKWCDALCVSALPQAQYRCRCPYEGCSALIINECEDESVRKVQCPNCKKDFCFKCQVPWHERNRCSEKSHKDRNDAMFAKLVQRKGWRRCYKCGHWVERVSGCNTIRCRCGARFCYLCGERHLVHIPCREEESSTLHNVCCICICFIVMAVTVGWTVFVVVDLCK